MIKLSDYVMDFIYEQGVRDIFVLSGGGNIHLIDSLGKSKLNYICNLQEQPAAIAADAYSQYTNNLGVCLVTTGPGGTNTLTGVAASWLDSIPVLIISGQVQTKDINVDRGVRQIGFQEIDIVSMVEPITKYAVTVTDEKDIQRILIKAVNIAKSGRPGPVWIDIPLDIQNKMIDVNTLDSDKPVRISKELASEVSKVVELLKTSVRPVLLIGNGVRLSNADYELKELTDILKIPVLLTWKAIDLMKETNCNYCGRPGMAGQRGANFTQQKSDLLITVGARLDHGQTAFRHDYFAKNARKVIVDIDIYEIRKLEMNIDLIFNIDAKQFLKELIFQLKEINYKPLHIDWLKKSKELHERFPIVTDEMKGQFNYNNYIFIDLLSDILRDDDVLVLGSSGASSEVSMQTLKVYKNIRVINSQGLGSMGFGISAAIGTCVASGYKRTILIEGDGGFFMNVQELEVIRRLKLPITMFVLNNNGYGSIRSTQEAHFDNRYVASTPESGMTLPNLKKVARGFNINYTNIKQVVTEDELYNVLEIGGPIICEIFLPEKSEKLYKTGVYKKEDGSFDARPMEDLLPLLDRNVFNEIMDR